MLQGSNVMELLETMSQGVAECEQYDSLAIVEYVR